MVIPKYILWKHNLNICEYLSERNVFFIFGDINNILGVDGNKQVGSALDLVAGVSQVSFHSDDPKWIEVTFSMEDGVKL